MKQAVLVWCSKQTKKMCYPLIWNQKIKEFERCLQQVTENLLSKIVVIKNFALPKLIYPLASLQNPTKEMIKRIEKLVYDFFLWDT